GRLRIAAECRPAGTLTGRGQVPCPPSDGRRAREIYFSRQRTAPALPGAVEKCPALTATAWGALTPGIVGAAPAGASRPPSATTSAGVSRAAAAGAGAVRFAFWSPCGTAGTAGPHVAAWERRGLASGMPFWSTQTKELVLPDTGAG